ncbi:MAG TPA: ABC transporter permease, partial [Deinococcales bacterium]|nr:ABC transporter permease [Deinococcales bacterium]
MNFVAAYRIAQRDLMAQLRSRAFYAQSLLLPLLLTLIIGAALGGGRHLDPVNVAVVGQDSTLLRGLESVLRDSRTATLAHPSRDVAVSGVNAGRYTAAVFVPPDLQPQLESEKGRATVTVLTDPASRVAAVTIVQIVKAYFSTLEAGRAGALAIVQAANPPAGADRARVTARAEAGMQQALSNPQVQLATRTVTGQAAGYFSYYAIAFGVMFTLMSAAVS